MSSLRDKFIVHGSALMALVLLNTMVAGQGLRVRTNYRQLQEPELQAFVGKVLELKATREVDPPGCNEAAVCDPDTLPAGCCLYTNTYDKFVYWHSKCACAGDNQHSGPQFPAWHRELVRRFELAMGMPIPYWVWPEEFPAFLDLSNFDKDKCIAPAAKVGTPCAANTACDSTGGAGDGVCGWKVNVAPLGKCSGTLNFCLVDRHCPPGETCNHEDSLKRGDLMGARPSLDDIEATLQTKPYDVAPWVDRLCSVTQTKQCGGDLDCPMGETCVATATQDAFRNSLERLHDSAHLFVGGQMANATSSANDPVFWLHHCFVDCLWARWQTNHNPDYLPEGRSVCMAPESNDGNPCTTNASCNSNPTPKPPDGVCGCQGDARIGGHCDQDPMGPWNDKTSAGVLDIRQLGYAYGGQPFHDKIPAVSQWGIVVMALLALTAGTVVLILRRAMIADTGR